MLMRQYVGHVITDYPQLTMFSLLTDAVHNQVKQKQVPTHIAGYFSWKTRLRYSGWLVMFTDVASIIVLFLLNHVM